MELTVFSACTESSVIFFVECNRCLGFFQQGVSERDAFQSNSAGCTVTHIICPLMADFNSMLKKYLALKPEVSLAQGKHWGGIPAERNGGH